MSFPRYPSYKPSGVEWLGDVPSHWDVAPLKRDFFVVGGSTPRSDVADYWDGDIPWATPLDLSASGIPTLSATARNITSAGLASCGTTVVPAGSLLLSTRAPIGSRAIAGVPMCTNQGCRALVARTGTAVPFFAYALAASVPALNTFGRGSTFLELSGETLGAFKVPTPPESEQKAVVAFLDRETAKIDALVAEQERLLELLKEKRQAVISHAVTKGLNPDAPMRPSGIEWLGALPSHWALPPLYLRYKQALGKMLDHAKLTGEHPMPYLRNVDVRWDFINVDDLPTMDIAPSERDRYTVRRGDLLTVEGRELGRSAIWAGDNGVVAFQKALHRLRPLDSNEYPRFFYYTMVFAHARQVFMAGQSPVEIPHLTGEDLRRFRFPRPPVEEQVQISAHLDDVNLAFDRSASAIGRSLQLLQQRRSTLISAAVTGHIDVRGSAPSEAA